MADKKEDVTRRDFLRKASAIAGGAALGTAAVQTKTASAQTYKSIIPQTVLGANEKILTGHIGVGGMGTRNMQFCVTIRDDIQPIAVCDLHPKHRERAMGLTQSKYDKPSEHVYFEEVLENKDVDAVVIVTPDHWHTIPSIMAAEAGKDIWCEKPLTTTMAEGQPIIDAVRKNNVILQCGNFQRSGWHFQEAVQMIQEGYIGKVARAETWIHDGGKRQDIGPGTTDMSEFEWLDWDRYIGWTDKVPFNSNRFIYNFRWFLDYSGGKMTDWGAHLLDIVVWAMGEENQPTRVTAYGDKFVLDDNRTTPDQLDVLYDYDDYVVSFSNRVYNGFVERNRYGIMFYGDKGTLYLDRTGYEVFPQEDGCEAKKVEGIQEMDMNLAHWQNFVDSVKSRKDPICYVESAFNTAKTCHMGTTAYVAGGEIEWNEAKGKFEGANKEANKAANKWAFREYQNGWSLDKPYNKEWA